VNIHSRLFPLAILIFVSPLAMADEDLAECRLRPETPERVTQLHGKPSYFAKVSSDGKFLSYIGGGNNLEDLDHPNTVVSLPGSYDAVPLPPTGKGENRRQRFFAVPMSGSGMTFYSLDAAKGKVQPGKSGGASNLPELFHDPAVSENYQSFGLVSPGNDDGDGAVYRMVSGSLKLSEYNTSTTDSAAWSANDLGKACLNSGNFKLPMISKDGQELSVYSNDTHTTQIYKINDGSCTLELDLGFATGKVEFSYDNKAITFHVDSYSSSKEGGEFVRVGGDMSKNVYVLELNREGDQVKPGKLRKLSANLKKGTGSYYPSFTEDGRVAFLQGDEDSRGNVRYAVHTIDPETVPSTTSLYTGSCKSPDELPAIFALGALWSKICNHDLDSQMRPVDAAMWTLSLDTDACKKLVNSHWKDTRSAILGDQRITTGTKKGAPARVSHSELEDVTVDALLAACPTDTGVKTPVLRRVGDVDTALDKGQTYPVLGTGKETFNAICNGCHSGSSSAKKFDYDALSKVEVNNMIIAIESGAMPDGENIANREEALGPLLKDLYEHQGADR
jgi:hypothetical protein